MRNPLTDTPEWRYGTALAELDREHANIPVYEPCNDPIVKALKRLIPLRRGQGRVDPDKLISSSAMHALEVACRIFEDQSVGGLRDIMEAALLAKDAPADFFQTHVSSKLNQATIQLYRDAFYDIQSERDTVFWVHRNLFVPNKAISNEEKFTTAYMWKVVAYHGGVQYFTNYAIDGMSFEDELRDWLRTMGVSRYVRQVLKSSHSYAKLLDGAGTPALPAVEKWDKAKEPNTGSGPETITEAGKAISDAIIRKPDNNMAHEKEFIMSHKYTDED